MVHEPYGVAALIVPWNDPLGLAAQMLAATLVTGRRGLRAGTVKVNDVWGGAPGGAAQPQKASGLGFGYGPELLDEVTTTKVVHYSPAPRPRADR